MEYTVKNLLAIAQEEIGYKEKASNSKLDEKTSNAGDKNYTKYARDLYAAGYYGGMNKQAVAWCDMFVDWCFYQLTGKDAKKAQELEYQTGIYGAGCKYSAQYYKNANRFYSTPEAGDQIFFGKKGSESHTGIVESVTSTKVNTIEGNSGNQVIRHTYDRNYSNIAGYGRPNYKKVVSTTTTTTNTKTEVKTTVKNTTSTTVKNTTKAQIKKGAKGALVKELQNDLIKLGYSCGKYGADGTFGQDTDKAVRLFQKNNGLTIDGIVGKKTWAAIEKKINQIPAKVLKIGSSVKIKNGAKDYNGKKLASFVYGRTYKVKQISGNRVVVTLLGITVAAVNKKDLILV